jgi:hypothetical protein
VVTVETLLGVEIVNDPKPPIFKNLTMTCRGVTERRAPRTGRSPGVAAAEFLEPLCASAWTRRVALSSLHPKRLRGGG